MADDRQWLTVALEHGAKITRSYFYKGLWLVLDQPDTILWNAFFNSAENAARAYCQVHHVPWPAHAAPERVRALATLMQKE
jgi:hypothetical protein